MQLTAAVFSMPIIYEHGNAALDQPKDLTTPLFHFQLLPAANAQKNMREQGWYQVILHPVTTHSSGISQGRHHCQTHNKLHFSDRAHLWTCAGWEQRESTPGLVVGLGNKQGPLVILLTQKQPQAVFVLCQASLPGLQRPNPSGIGTHCTYLYFLPWDTSLPSVCVISNYCRGEMPHEPKLTPS